MATYLVECEFVSGSYTDITGDIFESNITRSIGGFDKDLEVPAASIIVDNFYGRYSPRNSSSPLYPNVSVGKNLRIRCTDSGSTYYLFNGAITSIQINPDVGDRTALFTCEDVNMSTAFDKPVSLRPNMNEFISDYFTRICSTSGVNSYSTDPILDVVQYTSSFNRTPNELLKEIISNGYHWLIPNADGSIHLAGRSTKATDNTIVGSYHEFFSYAYEIRKDDVVNNISIRSTQRSLQDIYERALNVSAGTLMLNTGDNNFTLSFTDEVTNEDSCPFMYTYLYSSRYETTAVMSAGTDYTSSCSTYLDFYGSTVVASIYNPLSFPLYITNFEIYGNPLRKLYNLNVYSKDQTSISAYGEKLYDNENNLITSKPFLSEYTKFILWQKQDNIDKVKIGLKNVYPDILGINLGSLLWLVNTYTGVSGKYIVTRMDHTITMGAFIEHTLQIESDKWTTSDWFNLDADHLDIDRLGF